MSRSFGAFSFIRLPSIRNSPVEMSSRPATMFNVVDLPQPDGPTRMMNSPSAISMSTSDTASAPSGYRLLTLSRMISAMPLPLHGTGGQPRDDAALEEQHEQDDRDRDHHRGRGDGPGRIFELRGPGEERQRRRHRP